MTSAPPTDAALIAWVKEQQRAHILAAASLAAGDDPEGYSGVELEWADKFDAIAARLQQTGWQSIETAPKDGSGILVYPSPLFGADQAGVGYWDQDEGYEAWRDVEGERFAPQPTHWMPLPAPPATSEQKP